MSKLKYFVALLGLGILSCHSAPSEAQMNEWKEEVRKAETDFAQLATTEGIHKAFTTYAAEDAVLLRNNELVKGKSGIDQFYQGQNGTNLDWSPDFIDVSLSGDMAYTYGHYTFTQTDSLGTERQLTGIFHTVWKRQADGSWKFVWD